jgi:hypothetical protein
MNSDITIKAPVTANNSPQVEIPYARRHAKYGDRMRKCSRYFW